MLFSVSKPGEIFQNLDGTSSMRLPYGNLNTWRAQILRHSKTHKNIAARYCQPAWSLSYNDILTLAISCLPLICANTKCQSNDGSIGVATHGAHIVYKDRRRSGLFIAPLCKGCNMGDHDIEIYSGCPLLCVTSKSRTQNSKRKRQQFAVAQVRLLHDTVKVSVPVTP
jgi:hypothetical protein